MAKSKLWVWWFDCHSPDIDVPTRNCALQFLQENKVDGFGFGGDQNNNECISPHVRGKHRKIKTGEYARNTTKFFNELLLPVEQAIGKHAERRYVIGNHDDWESQYCDEHPELEGTIERHKILQLDKRGWDVVECGKSTKIGKLRVIHGEAISGGGANAARNALNQYCGSVLFGHFHSLQVATKVMANDAKQKWAAYCSPIIGKVNPSYLRNKPTAWVNGWTVVELHDNGNFNVVPIVCIGGKAGYGGRLYRG